MVLTEERESGLHHGRPERKELSKAAVNIFMVEGTGLFPVSETSSVMIRTATKCENEGCQDDSQDDNDLESREPELQFTKDLHTEVVDYDNCHHEYGNPNTWVDVVCGYSGPVCNDQGGCSELCGG